MRIQLLSLAIGLAIVASPAATRAAADGSAATWMADNGNGTFTNPLFYDEFSDPDLIRVGDDFYLTGTTMHTMPGLPVLHSRDLVNWRLLSYACERLDLGPAFRLEGGKEIYGQGIWAPCFRYRPSDGTFHIFTNVNRHKTQHFHAKNPAGPWTHTELGSSLHDLSVLFDDNGKVYVVWDYNEIKFAELKPDLSDIIPETKRVLIPRGNGMGEGVHFYKIAGRYYIISANYDPVGYMVCARADRPEGPYEITTISAEETFGVGTGWRLQGMGRGGPELTLIEPRPTQMGAIPMHQGGIVQASADEWWGFSMMDHNSIGRLTCLSPVTWKDGWPFFGLSGNLLRSPRTWQKPRVGPLPGASVAGTSAHAGKAPAGRFAPYQRNDDFSGPELANVWQWNHAPDNAKWSLEARKGYLRMHTMPAKDFWTARNTLTQRAVGPVSIPTAQLDVSGLRPGDVAGLALLNYPYAWIGVSKAADGSLSIAQHDQITGETRSGPLAAKKVWLRATCDFETEKATFSYSVDGATFESCGEEFTMVFQLKTFQGVRYGLFAFNQSGTTGGHADFAAFTVEEPEANGHGKRIPLGQVITLTSLADGARLVSWNGLLRPMSPEAPPASTDAARFRVHDRGRGRVALEAVDGSGMVTVTGIGGTGDVRVQQAPDETASTFQWQDLQRHGILLLSLATQRHLHAEPHGGGLASADSPGARPGRKDGACFAWSVIAP